MKKIGALLFLSATCLVYPHTIHLNEFDKAIFTCIYQTNAWCDQESRSGYGSNTAQTTNIRVLIPNLLRQLDVNILLDAPCGDFFWMNKINLDFLEYIGVDIVDEMIEDNKRKYGSLTRSFKVCNIAKDPVPYADLILCRDCFQHIKYSMIFSAIKNFKASGSKYLLLSNFPHITQNKDLENNDLVHLWRCRMLNMQLPPFNFPEPLLRLQEGFSQKELDLWELKDLPDF